MARRRGYHIAIIAAQALFAALLVAPAIAQDQGPNTGTDLYDRPVLAVDPDMHAGAIWSQAVDREGRFAVTGGADRTVRIWSLADGHLQQTIFIPVGPDPVGAVYAVAISPDGSTVAVGMGEGAIKLHEAKTGKHLRTLDSGKKSVSHLEFSADGQQSAAVRGELQVGD